MSLDVDRICVVVGRTRHKMVAIELQEAVKRGAKFIELRLDFLARAVDYKRLMAHKACPLVATVRRTADGGRWPGTEEQRQMVIRQAIVSGYFEWVDLETDVADTIRRFGKVKRIVSYHNFQEVPEDLGEIYEKMCNQDADVVKIAVMAQSPIDNLRILKLLERAPKPTVAHCMGDLGFPSRILALKYGAPFIYAAFNKDRGIAPGLPSMEDLRAIYPIDRINRETKVYAVLGDPIAQSYSPQLHNALFQKLNMDAVYVPMRVPRAQLQATLNAMESLPIHGYSVTIPHKETVATLAQEVSPMVAQTAAANTLVRRDNGFFADNTDAPAAVESIRSVAPKQADGTAYEFQGKAVVLLGSGGVARAIAHALKREGVNLTIAARNHAAALKLAEEVGAKAIDWQVRHNGSYDILVNCTPIGMFPNMNDSPTHPSYFRENTIVFDTVYNPENTLFLKTARERGCIVVSGLEMFVRQAGLQFQAFTGQEPPLEELRQLLRRAISPVTHHAATQAEGEGEGEGESEPTEGDE
ncbi:shikimate dehydrogenase [Tuwongella immobilis]|nr:shikimate dehydrogenase [Tuwongella immobilis]